MNTVILLDRYYMWYFFKIYLN